MRLHLDFETYSEAPLPQCGVHVYARHPSTEVLMLAWAIDDGPVQQWLPADSPMPFELVSALTDPAVLKVAFNAAFERLIFRDVLGIDIPAEQWRCTMVASYYLGFTAGLGAVLQQTGLSARKDPRGGRLIQMFSKPAPKNHKADRYTAKNKPAEWLEFLDYNVQDVVVERQLWHWLARFPAMHDWDWGRYALDQRINDRGVYCDVDMAAGAVEMWGHERDHLTQQLRELTGLPKVTRGPFMEWLTEQGLALNDLRKDTLRALDPQPPHIEQALALWSAKEAKAVSKYSAVLRGVCDDHRARGLFQFKGASRTDRDAGRRIQLQNLKRSVASTDAAAANLCSAVATADPTLLSLVSGDNVSDALGYSIRHCFQAPPGQSLTVCDLTSIESVVTGWLTNCTGINDIFASGKDTYKPFAARYYGIGYDEVTKEQRTFAKPAVLGASYGLGARGLVAYAKDMGVSLTQSESKGMVDTFRAMYMEIPAFWGWIVDAFKYVTLTRQPCEGYGLQMERDDEFLRIWLPSGRAISYQHPEIKKRVAPWSMVETPYDFGDDDPLHCIRAKFPALSDGELAERGLLTADTWLDNVSFMGANKAGQWVRTYAHGGFLLENCVQSIAYDILFEGITNAEAAGLTVVSRVHDEIVCEGGDLAVLKECMTRRPTWARDMWLGAEGYIGKYYRKD